MTVKDLQLAEQTVEQWRTVACADNPAGPLYASGTFAEADLIEAETSYTGVCSACSASHTHPCC
ncbi:DUF6229 family protein [Actinoallomurus sp. NPDC052308]|uniref:DUF6229 family protein n=1 Tax=Actinoallomurus sp. NPDC052308 TaxID=3155530 RepID=UPI0034403DF3